MSLEVTWWGASCVEIAAAGRRLLIDPRPPLPEAPFDGICITREDHDHLDPAALRTLAGRGCGRVLMPRACAELDRISAPLAPGARDLSLDPARVAYVAPHRVRDPDATTAPPLEVAGFRIEAWESSVREPPSIIERWVRLREEGEPLWPSDVGPLLPSGELTPLGYLVTDLGSGASVLHPGDLQEVFDVHRELRGRVDLICLPLPATEGIAISLLDAIRPRLVLPIHFRPDGIEPELARSGRFTAVDLASGLPAPGARPDAYRSQLQDLIEVGWFPSPADPAAVLAELAPRVEALGCRLLASAPGEALTVKARAVSGR